VLESLWIHNGVIMHLFRLTIGRSLVAVGFVSTLVAFYWITNTGGESPYTYVVWGLGLSAMMLGFKSLPKKKRRRESPSAGRSPGRSGDNLRELPATERQKSLARAPGITSPTSTSMENSPDLITEERASER
jgi:hypothetical protein